MRQRFGLPLPERQIGQAAHDFMMLMGAEEIMLTRAERVSGTPTVPTRWLVRLTALVDGLTGGNAERYLSDPKWQEWVAALDAETIYAPSSAPRPAPPVAARPRQLSVTAIETLMRDPYSIYAQYILRAVKAGPAGRNAKCGAFRKIISRGAGTFFQTLSHCASGKYRTSTLGKRAGGAGAFRSMPAVHSFWLPRYRHICGWIAEMERVTRPTVHALLSERKGKWQWLSTAGPFTLTARMDRVELGNNGTLSIIDYKTGSLPTTQAIATGVSCQLPLSAIIAEKGVVEDIPRNSKILALCYWKLGGNDGGLVMDIAKADHAILQTLIEQAQKACRRSSPISIMRSIPIMHYRGTMPRRNITTMRISHVMRNGLKARCHASLAAHGQAHPNRAMRW